MYWMEIYFEASNFGVTKFHSLNQMSRLNNKYISVFPKRKGKPKGQSKMYNPEKLPTLNTQDENKQY